jgi:hypothetical protein
MTGTEWCIGMAVTLAIALLICAVAFTLDAILNRSPLRDEPCQICPDQWGLFCSTHAERVTTFQSCPGRR